MPAEATGGATLATLLERAARVAAARGAGGGPPVGLRFVDRRERETWVGWDEIAAAADAVARSLVGLGVGAGERVALVYPTGRDFFAAFFGAVLCGAVPTPLYPPVRLGRLDEYQRRTAAMLRASGARLVLAETRVRRVLGPAVAAAAPALGCRTLDELAPGAPVAAERAPSPDDLGLVQFSSGTTVDPKPVALTHRALLAQVRALNGFWPRLASSDGTPPTGVSWLPLYHDMGLIGCVLTALEIPSTMTLLGPELFVARPALWLRALSRHRATISVAPNFAYGLAVEKVRDDELDGVDLSAWRVALNGAEPVAPGVLRAFAERFARWGFRREALTPVYGLSEAALAVTFAPLGRGFASARFDRGALADEGVARPADDGVEIVSLGEPLAGFALRLLDDEGREVPAGRIGRLWVRGPSLMAGYLGRPDATAAVLHDGWLDTGDLGFLHGGELYLTGRAKDVVILRGQNHSPVEIEQAAATVAGVRAGCAVAVSWRPEDAPGERLLVFVEHRRAAPAGDRDAIPRGVREAVTAACGLTPDEVHLLAPGTLPRTSSGKLRRAETLERHRRGTLLPPRRVTPLLVGEALARSALAYRRLRRGRRSGGG